MPGHKPLPGNGGGGDPVPGISPFTAKVSVATSGEATFSFPAGTQIIQIRSREHSNLLLAWAGGKIDTGDFITVVSGGTYSNHDLNTQATVFLRAESDTIAEIEYWT